MLKRIFNALIEGRQRTADLHIARMMRSEYPNESVQYIAKAIREQKQ